MKAKLQTQIQAKAMPKPTFTPVRTGLLQRKCACGGSPGVDGECAECRKKRLSLQRRAANEAGPAKVPPIVHNVLRSAGQALDPATRALMEPRFGHDFSQVRVHTDAKAAESARAVNALAYTVGQDVVFGTRQYAPASVEGRQLLAHELTHVVQQGANTMHAQGISPANVPSEIEADAVASNISDEHLPSIQQGASPGVLHRQEDTKKQESTPKKKITKHTLVKLPPVPDFQLTMPKLKFADYQASHRLVPQLTKPFSNEPSRDTPTFPDLRLPPSFKPDFPPPSPSPVLESVPPVPESTKSEKQADSGKPRLGSTTNVEVEADPKERQVTGNISQSITWRNLNLRSFLHGKIDLLHEPGVGIQTKFLLPNVPGAPASFNSAAIQGSVALLDVHVLKEHGDDIIEVALNTTLGPEVTSGGSVNLSGSLSVQPLVHIGKLNIQEHDIPGSDVSLYLNLNANPSVRLRRGSDADPEDHAVVKLGTSITAGIQVQF